MVISKKIWSRVGRFDETMEAGWEDFDYEIRCHNAGFKIDVLNIPVEHVGKGTRFEEVGYMNRWESTRRIYGQKHGVVTRSYDGKVEN